MASNCFHEVVIGGIKFSGVLSADGPYISCKDPSGRIGGVALGVSSIAKIHENFEHDPFGGTADEPHGWTLRGVGNERWYLVKYSHEHAFLLDSRAAG